MRRIKRLDFLVDRCPDVMMSRSKLNHLIQPTVFQV
jgi:hypothetical protein